jgi:hypothetical protein
VKVVVIVGEIEIGEVGVLGSQRKVEPTECE